MVWGRCHHLNLWSKGRASHVWRDLYRPNQKMNSIRTIIRFLASKIHYFSVLIILILIFFAYCNTFHSPPALDDFHSFIDEPLVRVDNWSLQNVLSLSKTKFGWERWIPMISFSWDVWLGGGKFFYLHLTNFLVHVGTFLAVIFLVFALGRAARARQSGEWPENALQEPLPQRQESKRSLIPWIPALAKMTHQGTNRGLERLPAGNVRERIPEPFWLAVWVAGIWSLQPVQTSAVTYLVQRMTSLVALFYILSVACYVLARCFTMQQRSAVWPARYLYFGCGACMVLSFLSKENSATLPFMLVATEMWFFRPELLVAAYRYCKKHRLLIAMATLVAGYFALQYLFVMQGRYSVRHFTMLERLMTETRVLVWYISLLFWPAPGRLSLEHDVPVSTSLIHPWTTFFSAGMLLALLIFTVWKRRRYPLMTYGLLWFFLNSAIESTVYPLELVFEHRVYLPSVGLLLAAVVGVYSLCSAKFSAVSRKDFATVSWCVFALCLSPLTLATFERNSAWANIVSINADAAIKAPDNPRAHSNYAVALARVGRHEEAIGEAKRSIALGKKNFECYLVNANTIFLSYTDRGKYTEAIEELKALLHEKPLLTTTQGLFTLYSNLAVIQERIGNHRGAYDAVREGLGYMGELGKYDRDFIETSEKILLTAVNKASVRSIDLNGDGIADPGGLPPRTWIAREFLKMDRRDEARHMLEASIAAYPRQEEGRKLLAGIKKADELDKIQRENWNFDERFVAKPFSRFNASMALAFLVQKHLPSSFSWLGRPFLEYALAIQPEAPEAHLLEGWYHFDRGEVLPAISCANMAIQLNPQYAKAWLGLGFFLKKGHQDEEAVAAFQKTLELFPGYPQRGLIKGMIASYRNGSDARTKERASAQAQSIFN